LLVSRELATISSMPVKKKREDEIFENLGLYFGKALARLRGHKSAESLARSAGMDAGTLRRLENDKAPFRKNYVAGILQSLNFTFADFLRIVADCYQEAETVPYDQMSRDELLHSLYKLQETRARLEREASMIDLEIKRRQIPDAGPSG
jgi:transcriptional regulator with XRE-family HTH domain